MTRIALALILLAGSTHAQTWTELKPTGEAPTPRNNAAGIYDPIGHRLIVFAGLVPGDITSDVWALDLDQNAWTRLAGPGAGIYDTRGHRFLTFGGGQVGGGGVKSDETWAFDLERGEWSLLQPSKFALQNPRPNTRYGTGAIFDPMANRLVTFAGFTEEGRFDDTWAFAPTTATWTNLGLVANPGRRCLHTASYDPGEHRMIIYGGQRSGELGDLWALDLDTHVWTEFTPAASRQGRTFPTSVYDAHGQRFIIFGGVGTKVRLIDVWALEGLAPAPPPTAVEAASWGTVKAERKNTPRNIPAND